MSLIKGIGPKRVNISVLGNFALQRDILFYFSYSFNVSVTQITLYTIKVSRFTKTYSLNLSIDRPSQVFAVVNF